MKVAEGFTQRDGSTPIYVTQENLMPGYAAFPMVLDAPFKINIDNCLIGMHGVSYWFLLVERIQYIKASNQLSAV